MDTDQRKTLSLVIEGHNLLIIGQAGTGKMLTIRECVKHLRRMGKQVYLTGYTGISCLQYKSMNAMTLHKFSGLEDGVTQITNCLI